MVALPPLAATTTFPGLNRPAPVTQPGAVSDSARAPDAPALSSAASAKIRQQQDQAAALAEQAQAQNQRSGESRQTPSLPPSPYAQNVGLFDNSFRVFVDIVLSGDENRTVARVFGTPPAQKPNAVASTPVNIVA
ncbi:MAG: hypothetical protein C6Y20_01950 [Tagaea sp. CACIAM 22H2]|nr:hypothetical protein [Tagaea sp. CACIAM 22H2]